MNFRDAVQSSHITFRAAEPNSISAKKNADTKNILQVMFISRKKIGHLTFLSGCHGSSKILGYICFSLIKIMLHSDDIILFAVFYKKYVIDRNINNKVKELKY